MKARNGCNLRVASDLLEDLDSKPFVEKPVVFPLSLSLPRDGPSTGSDSGAFDDGRLMLDLSLYQSFGVSDEPALDPPPTGVVGTDFTPISVPCVCNSATDANDAAPEPSMTSVFFSPPRIRCAR